jgi:antitoxin CptB
MLELDLLLQQFVKQRYDSLDAATRTAFVTLLDYPDAVLLDLLMGRSATADPEIARVVEDIRAAT